MNEFGLIVPKGLRRPDELMELMEADDTIPEQARLAANHLFDQLQAGKERIKALEPKSFLTRGMMKPPGVYRRSPASDRSQLP